MQTKEFVQFLASSNAVVFTLEDAVKILDSGNGYASLFLHRCIEKGLIGRVERGVYYLKKMANEYEVASSILMPSYVSMVSALAYYGLTTQIPRFVYVVSTKRHKPIRGIGGFDIIFKHVRDCKRATAANEYVCTAALIHSKHATAVAALEFVIIC